jgi:4-amino-4-deoxy-L-arabinose transferase-like glycosyltransferase
MKKLWRNYNLSIVLVALFVLSWVAQTLAGWQEFTSEQEQHGQAAQVFASDGYVWTWATFENWQSEFLQLLTMVVLTSFLIHKGSAESRDSQDEMQRSLDRIEKHLKELNSGEPGRTKSSHQNGAKSSPKKKAARRKTPK